MLEFHFPAPGLKVMSGPLLSSAHEVLFFSSLRELFLGSLVSDSTPGLAPVSLPQAPWAPKGPRPLCFHRPALPHHKSLPINALSVQAGHAGQGWTLCPVASEATAAFPSRVGDHLGTGERG